MSHTTPAVLDLGTINEVQQVVVRALRDRVCQWEQDSMDASKRGEYAAAQQYQQWAVAAELCASAVSTACAAIFLDAYSSLTVLTDYRKVELPNLGRSSEDHYLDALQVEVASHQPDPF